MYYFIGAGDINIATIARLVVSIRHTCAAGNTGTWIWIWIMFIIRCYLSSWRRICPPGGGSVHLHQCHHVVAISIHHLLRLSSPYITISIIIVIIMYYRIGVRCPLNIATIAGLVSLHTRPSGQGRLSKHYLHWSR